MLVKIAKGVCFRFKKLSDFRLEIYKKYGGKSTGRTAVVENPVESVEFHPKSGRGSLLFEHSPQGFQHVEKMSRFYNGYILPNVENFCRRKNHG